MKTQDKLLITLGTAAVLAVSGFVGFSLFATPDSQASTGSSSQIASSNQTSTTPSTGATSNTSPSSASSTTNSSYKDGTYTATSSYMVPHGAQNSITSTIVVSGGKITSVTTSNDYSDRESASYIDWFNQEISSAVTGQSLGDVSVSRVGGASLTQALLMTRSTQFALKLRRNMFEFDGIGTHWWIENLAGEGFDARTRQAVLQYVQEFDDAYSRFKPESYIGILNSKKYLKNPPKKLLEMLDFCHEMYSVSEGAFDITVGGILHAEGYGSREMASVTVPNFWNEVKYNRDEIRIPAEAVIDTGGYGKGWLIDELVDLLAARSYKNIIVNGGGDLRIVHNAPVEFALEHPHDASQKVGTTHIQNGALAVSSPSKRTWKHAGKVHHHVVDPATKASLANNVAATFVQAPTARIADTLATIAMIRPDLLPALRDCYDAKIVVLYTEQLA